jgi:hypothetical protein
VTARSSGRLLGTPLTVVVRRVKSEKEILDWSSGIEFSPTYYEKSPSSM